MFRFVDQVFFFFVKRKGKEWNSLQNAYERRRYKCRSRQVTQEIVSPTVEGGMVSLSLWNFYITFALIVHGCFNLSAKRWREVFSLFMWLGIFIMINWRWIHHNVDFFTTSWVSFTKIIVIETTASDVLSHGFFLLSARFRRLNWTTCCWIRGKNIKNYN